MKTTRTGYLLLRGKTYYAVWTVNGKKFMKTTGHTVESKAKTELARIMEPFRVGDVVTTLEHVKAKIERSKGQLTTLADEQNPPLSITRSWDDYLSSPNRPDSGPVTLAQYESHFDQFAAWIVKTHPQVTSLRDVTKDMATEYAGHLAQRGLSANRFNKHIRFLSLFFRVLKDQARMAMNPWEGINRKRQNANARRELTVKELRRVCESATGELRLLLATGIYTGLRLGDAATLRWGEADILRGIIRRIPHKTASRNPKPVLVPIHPALRAMLAEIPETGRGEYVMPEISTLYRNDPIVLNRNLQDHFKKNGITLHKPGTGVEKKIGDDGKIKNVNTGKRAVLEVGFHSLRHTFVSLCRAADAPLSVVESIVGHSNPSMTRHYTHTSEAAALTAVSALPSVMGGEIKALPPAQSPRLVDAGPIRERLQAMTAANWKKIRDELLTTTA